MLSLPQLQAGALRALASGSLTRDPQLPDLPTVAEQGYPGFETSQWYGLNAPAKTPEAVIARLADAAAKAAKSPLVAERLAPDDAEPIGSSPAEYAAYVQQDAKRMLPLIDAAGLREN